MGVVRRRRGRRVDYTGNRRRLTCPEFAARRDVVSRRSENIVRMGGCRSGGRGHDIIFNGRTTNGIVVQATGFLGTRSRLRRGRLRLRLRLRRRRRRSRRRVGEVGRGLGERWLL